MGRGAACRLGGARRGRSLSAFVDTNVLIRHLTGDPPAMARRATRLLATEEELLLADIVIAECVYVLESVYAVARPRVAEVMRSALALPTVRTADTLHLLRALELYETKGVHFAEAYLVAAAEITGIGAVASFDEAIDRIPSVTRIAP